MAGRRSPVSRYRRLAILAEIPEGSVEIEVANRLLDWGVLRLLQPLGEFSREHIFLRALGFNRRAELRLDCFIMLAKKPCSVVEIDGGRRLRWWDVREDDAEAAINRQLGRAAGTTHLERLALFRHARILRSLARDGKCRRDTDSRECAVPS